jgi:hypothetical protein
MKRIGDTIKGTVLPLVFFIIMVGIAFLMRMAMVMRYIH